MFLLVSVHNLEDLYVLVVTDSLRSGFNRPSKQGTRGAQAAATAAILWNVELATLKVSI
jgi:hypothetical protein